MTTGALLFLIGSWTFVLGLTLWAFARILRLQKHFDPDGIGPAVPPVAGVEDPASGRRPPPEV